MLSIDIRGHGSVRLVVLSQTEFEGDSSKTPIFIISSVNERSEISESTELVIPIGQVLSEVVSRFEVST